MKKLTIIILIFTFSAGVSHAELTPPISVNSDRANQTIQISSYELFLFNNFSYPAVIYLHGTDGSVHNAYFVDNGQKVPPPQKRGNIIDLYYPVSRLGDVIESLRRDKFKYLYWIEGDESYAYIKGND